jgi:hypothetical protein
MIAAGLQFFKSPTIVYHTPPLLSNPRYASAVTGARTDSSRFLSTSGETNGITYFIGYTHGGCSSGIPTGTVLSRQLNIGGHSLWFLNLFNP